MEELKNHIYDEHNGLRYTLVGDYYIPDLELPEGTLPIGIWGRMHKDYLEQYHPAQYNDLILSGRLWTYLADLNEQAQNRLGCIIVQMKGNIEPTEYDTIACKEYKEVLRLITRNEEKLLATMTDEQKELFSRYTDAVQEYQTMAECLLFQSSFKLGAKMMVEVMDDR